MISTSPMAASMMAGHHKDDEVKIDALKSLISAIANGEQYPKLLIYIIKFTFRQPSHQKASIDVLGNC
jgi:vesicle coat complex subunit